MGDSITLESLHNDVQLLAGNLLKVAKQTYNKNDEYPWDEEEDMEKMPIEGPAGTPRTADDPEEYSNIMGKDHNGHDYEDNDMDMMPAMRKDEYPEDPNGNGMPMMDEDEEEVMMGYKSYKAKVRSKQAMKKAAQKAYVKGLKKGYADAAQENADEHDAPFGEKDGDLDGNEAQPAGDMNGDREDETFGPGGMAYSAMLKQLNTLTATVQKLQSEGGEGQVIAQVDVPTIGRISKGTPSDTNPQMLTRDMQEQAKGLTYLQLNRIREEMGDLPKIGNR